MKFVQNLGIIGILLACMGCLSAFQKVAENANKRLNQMEGTLDDMKAMSGKARSAITVISKKVEGLDTNKDGNLSWKEILAGLGLLGASGGAIVARNAKSNARKTIIESRLDRLDRPTG